MTRWVTGSQQTEQFVGSSDFSGVCQPPETRQIPNINCDPVLGLCTHPAVSATNPIKDRLDSDHQLLRSLTHVQYTKSIKT